MRRKRSKQSADGFVGIVAVDIHFPETGSLKGKRQYLRSIKASLSRHLGASIAEVGFHDLWQRSRLLVSICATSGPEAERAVEMAVEWFHARDYQISGIHKEIIKVEGQD